MCAGSMKALGESQDEAAKQVRINAKRLEAGLGQVTRVEQMVEQLVQRLDALANSNFEERIAKAQDSFESLAKAVHKQQARARVRARTHTHTHTRARAHTHTHTQRNTGGLVDGRREIHPVQIGGLR